MYIILLKVYCSSFSAVAVGMFNWPMIDLLQNKDELLKWAVHTFKCDKKERETWKVQCGSSKWKVYYIVYEKIWTLHYEFADARINCFS